MSKSKHKYFKQFFENVVLCNFRVLKKIKLIREWKTGCAALQHAILVQCVYKIFV